MSDNLRCILRGAGVFFLMAFVSAAVGGLVFQQAVYGGDPSESAIENSIIEQVQFGLLILCTVLVAAAAARRRDGRAGYALVASFFACMAIRECDNFFDKLLFHGAWFPFVLAVAAAAIVAAVLHWKQTHAGMAAIVRDTYFGLLSAGLSVILVFSRILGHKSIWITIYRDICGEEKAEALSRAMKNLAEEGTELFGYTLLAFWAVALLAGSRECGRDSARQQGRPG